MENSCKETILNLARSFAGESQARERYWIYAQVARKEGYEWIARVFEETADNEAVHAEEFLERMQKLGGCADNIDITAGTPTPWAPPWRIWLLPLPESCMSTTMPIPPLRRWPAGRAVTMPPACGCRLPGSKASTIIPSSKCTTS